MIIVNLGEILEHLCHEWAQYLTFILVQMSVSNNAEAQNILMVLRY
jgi:hypothetical protein